MAEKRITRTVKTFSVTVLCLDTETAEPSNITIQIGGRFSNEEKLFKAVAEKINKPNFKAVKIVSVKENTELRYMPESVFVENSIPVVKNN